MKRQTKSSPLVSEIGSASRLTKGSWGPYSDEQLMQLHPGLTRD